MRFVLVFTGVKYELIYNMRGDKTFHFVCKNAPSGIMIALPVLCHFIRLGSHKKNPVFLRLG